MSHFHSESLGKCFTTFELRWKRDSAGSPCGCLHAARAPRASPPFCRLRGLEETASQTPTLYTPRPPYPLRLAVAAAAVAEQEVRLTESLPRICLWPNQPDALMQCFRGVQGFHVTHTCTVITPSPLPALSRAGRAGTCTGHGASCRAVLPRHPRLHVRESCFESRTPLLAMQNVSFTSQLIGKEDRISSTNQFSCTSCHVFRILMA